MRLYLPCLLAAVACGPSLAQVKRARSATYDAPFADVWQAVAAEVAARYRRVRDADPAGGSLRTEWTVVRTLSVDDGADGMGREERTRRTRLPDVQRLNPIPPKGNYAFKHIVFDQQRTAAPGAREGDPDATDLFQARVRIIGDGVRWRIVVDGEGAQYVPGEPQLRPYRDRPDWVDQRVDELYVAIHARLSR
jgi:hypothetical protein